VELKDVVQEGVGDAGIISLIVGVISAGVFSYLSIAWLLNFLQDSEYLGIHLVSLVVWSGNFECDLCRTAAKHLANINSSFFSRDATGESICGDCLFLERG
jgi:hypothetical protein